MDKKIRTKKTSMIYLLVFMLFGALLAFILFYVFLVDTFGIFKHSDTTEQSSTIVQEEDPPVEYNTDILDIGIPLQEDSDISPAHGDENTAIDLQYPIEEALVQARTLAEWTNEWYQINKNAVAQKTARPPILAFAKRITELGFSAGNGKPTAEETLTIIEYTSSAYFDALFLNDKNFPNKEEKVLLKEYLIRSLTTILTVLDAIKSLPAIQAETFTQYIQTQQNNKRIIQNITQINIKIQENKKNNTPKNLPMLAENKFSLQNALEEQKRVLQRYIEIFSRFYSRSDIRYIPLPIAQEMVTAITLYAPAESWKNYTTKLITIITQSIAQLQKY